LESAELLLQSLVIAHRNGAAAARRSLRAFRPESARAAGFRIKFDDCTGLERFDFAGRAVNRAAADIDLEVPFAKQARLDVGMGVGAALGTLLWLTYELAARWR
jgi:hypothetical protein